jgi:hypothetical protein
LQIHMMVTIHLSNDGKYNYTLIAYHIALYAARMRSLTLSLQPLSLPTVQTDVKMNLQLQKIRIIFILEVRHGSKLVLRRYSS